MTADAGEPIIRRRSERGMAALELLMLMPVLFLVILGMTQLAMVAQARSEAGDAALAAARADALGSDPQTAADAAVGRVADSVSARRVGSGATWQVTVQVRTVFPGADVEVEHTAVLP